MGEKTPNRSEPVSLEDFLKTQRLGAFLATIEEVQDHPDVVKVTPWAPRAGCMCHAALEVPKESIEAVTPTDDTHFCCGKVLHVGDVQFKPGAKIDLENVFAQITQSLAGGGHAAAPSPFPQS